MTGRPVGGSPSATAVLAVGLAEGDGDDVRRAEIRRLIPRLLRETFDACRLRHVWDQKWFADISGEAHRIGFDRAHLPYVIDLFLDSLQDVLFGYAPDLADRDIVPRLVVAVGLDRADEPGGGGTAAVLDAACLRDVLERTDPCVTLVAAAVSEQVMAEVVRAGRCQRKVSEFAPADLEGPTGIRTAYVYVPRPSNLGHGFGLLSDGLTGRFPLAETVGDRPRDGGAARAARWPVVVGAAPTNLLLTGETRLVPADRQPISAVAPTVGRVPGGRTLTVSASPGRHRDGP